MTYVKTNLLQISIFVLLLSLFCSCTSQKILLQNSTFIIETKGNIKKPALLFFSDINLKSNDSIIKELNKRYFVLTVIDTSMDVVLKQNSDNQLTRALNGISIYNQINNQLPLTGIAASGLECLHIINWGINVRPSEIHLYSLFNSSLNDYLRQQISFNQTAFKQYLNPINALDLYTLINSEIPSSGLINNYSYQYLKEFRNLTPSIHLKPYSGLLFINKLD